MTQKELGLAVGFEGKGERTTVSHSTKRITVSPSGELLDKIAEALRVDRQNFYTIAPRLRRGLHADILLARRGQPRLYPPVPTCPQSGQGGCLLMIPPYGTMTATTGSAHPPVGMYFQYGLVDEFMRGMAFAPAGGYTPGRSPGTSILNGNSTGPHTCDDSKESEYYIPWRKKQIRQAKNRPAEFVVQQGGFCLSFWDYSLESTGRTQIVSIQYQEPYGPGKKSLYSCGFAPF